LAGVLTRLRELVDIYKQLRAAGAAAFVSNAYTSSSRRDPSSPPISAGEGRLRAALEAWEAIDAELGTLNGAYDMSILR
jgi:hypothetical protein